MSRMSIGPAEGPRPSARPGVIVHGGAGSGRLAPDLLAPYRAGLAAAAEAGFATLAGGGSPLDAVEAAVRSMEAAGVFNAGRGSCLNIERAVECDAAIMVGADLRAGAAGAVRGFLHPVSIARKVLEETDHVLLVAEGAGRLATAFGIEPWSAPPAPEQLRKVEEIEAEVRDLPKGTRLARLRALLRHGADTVGAVAVDEGGRLAAAVSTGGLWLKLPGRVGDSAIPGAGVYADDRTGAVSATGVGEAIIRVALSRRATEAMAGASAQEGVEAAIRLLTERIGPDTAGLVGLDRTGAPGAACNTFAMGRAYLGAGMAAPAVAVERDEPFLEGAQPCRNPAE